MMAKDVDRVVMEAALEAAAVAAVEDSAVLAVEAAVVSEIVSKMTLKCFKAHTCCFRRNRFMKFFATFAAQNLIFYVQSLFFLPNETNTFFLARCLSHNG